MAEDSKIALITGASGGIGREVSMGLGADGYMLALVGRSRDSLQGLANEIMRNYSLKNLPLISPADLTIAEHAERVVDEVMERYGRIDILFNAIGIYKTGNWEIAPNAFEEQISTNVIGVLNIVRAVVPQMLKQGSGHIITMASRRGKIANAEEGAYSASKHAVIGMSEALFKELAPQGIKVTSLCPGWVNTPMVKDATFPKQEMISTQDILETVRFLLKLSPAACIKEIIIEPRSNLS
jgi:short-subunit dehydrogenase